MGEIEHILCELGLEHMAPIFAQNKVGPQEVLSLTEEEFAILGITAIGDKARLRQRCKAFVEGPHTDSAVVKRLKGLQDMRKRKQTFKGANEMLIAKKVQTTRRVYGGWKHSRNTSNGIYSLVPLSKGGGQHYLDLEKGASLQEITSKFCQLFFPNGVAGNGINLDKVDYFLGTFAGGRLQDMLKDGTTFTLENYYLETKTYPIRVYLYTANKSESEEHPCGSQELFHTSGGSTDGHSTELLANQDPVHTSMGTTITDNTHISDTLLHLEEGQCRSQEIFGRAGGSTCGQSTELSASHYPVHASTSTTIVDNTHISDTLLDLEVLQGGSQICLASSESSMSGGHYPVHTCTSTNTTCTVVDNTHNIDTLLHSFERQGASQDSSAGSGASKSGQNTELSVRSCPVHTSMSNTDLDDDSDSLPDLDSGTPSIVFNVRKRARLSLKKNVAMSMETDCDSGRKESLHEILTRLVSQTEPNESKNLVNVTRDNVLEGARRGFRRSTFNAKRGIHVRFSGEYGIDDGGPSREFMRLALKEICSSQIFQGEEKSRILCPDVQAEENGLYELYGRMMAYFIVHAGPPPKFLSEFMYCLLANGLEAHSPSINDVADYELRHQLKQLEDSEGAKMFHTATEPLMPIVDYIGAVPLASFEKKQQLLTALLEHIVIKRMHTIYYQFVNGLSCLGIHQEVARNPEVMRELFVYEETTLNSLLMDELFEVQFSPAGSNKHQKELKTQSHWRDFLQDMQEEDGGLQRVLVFVTGLDTVPPLGFCPTPELHFRHGDDYSDEELIPFANTCANIIAIPVLDSYDIFQERLKLAVEVGTTFTNG